MARSARKRGMCAVREYLKHMGRMDPSYPVHVQWRHARDRLIHLIYKIFRCCGGRFRRGGVKSANQTHELPRDRGRTPFPRGKEYLDPRSPPSIQELANSARGSEETWAPEAYRTRGCRAEEHGRSRPGRPVAMDAPAGRPARRHFGPQGALKHAAIRERAGRPGAALRLSAPEWRRSGPSPRRGVTSGAARQGDRGLRGRPGSGRRRRGRRESDEDGTCAPVWREP